jgi:carbamoyltransferase
MRIIGLHNDEDAGACLLEDGQILDAVNEERLNRTKLYKGRPERCLDYILDRHALTLSDIDYFVYGWHGRRNDYLEYAQRLTKRVIRAVQRNPECGAIIEDRLAVEIDRDGETRLDFEDWMASLEIPHEKIAFVDHHRSHAWAAFACSPFEDALIFTFDGRGDLKSVTASSGNRDTGITEHDYLLSFDSLGFLYGQITHYLGYTPHRHEGKVTGLAANGDPAQTLPLFRSLISSHNGRPEAQIGPYKPFYTDLHPDLIGELDQFSREDIAAGVQTHCEELVVTYIQQIIDELGSAASHNICLAGGVAANVKINQRVGEIPHIDNVYVFPHMGDGGLTVGSAIQHHWDITENSRVAMPTAYLGPSYDDTKIEASLVTFGNQIIVEKLDDKITTTVDALCADRVVGYFDNRMEFGPRALGARSILFHTRDASVNDWLNKRLHRTEFMPFAPVTPEEYAAECYADWRPDHVCAHFMTKTYDCLVEFRAKHPAVVHVDGTARPQIVTEEMNGDYYRIVKQYCDRTGDRALVNTSFNQHEEPIVCKTEDAVGSLLNDNVDMLIIGGFKVTRA